MSKFETVSSAIKQRVESGVSIKERAFFYFLEKSNQKFDFNVNQCSLIDKICVSAFTKEDIRITDVEISQIQNSHPLKGLHYTKNIIEIIAIALLKYTSEKEKLTKFYHNGTYRDKYIIRQIFTDFQNDTTGTPVSVIDKVAEALHNIDLQEKINIDLSKALQGAGGLIDFHLIKKACTTEWELHPDRELEKDLKTFILAHNTLKKNILEKTYNFYITLVSIIGTIIVLLLIVLFIKKWDAWNIEPALAILLPCFSILGFRVTKNHITNVVQKFAEQRVEEKYFKYGLLKSKLDKIEKKYN